jgi:hypothetical protein
MLLIHGSGVSARCWINQLRGLADTLHGPGHRSAGAGESERGCQRRVVRAGRRGRARGAEEWSGDRRRPLTRRSRRYRPRRPDAVRGVVFLESCAKISHTDGVGEGVLAAFPGPLRKIVFFSLAKKLLFAPGVPAHAVSLSLHELRACCPEPILKDVRAAKAMDLTDRAARLDVPPSSCAGAATS